MRLLPLSAPCPPDAVREVKAPPQNKKPRSLFRCRALSENGAGEETRTLDVHLGKVVLYQLSYARKQDGKTIACAGARQQVF